MKKNIPLIVLMAFLMVMNGILLYLVIQKPDKKRRPPRALITEELGFDDAQMTAFFDLEEGHRKKMREIDRRTLELREELFMYLEDNNSRGMKIDSLGDLIGTLAKQRELELFEHFDAIEKICNERQKKKLRKLVNGALRPGPPGGPPHHHQHGPPPR